VDLWAVIAGGPYCSKRHLLGPWHTGNKRASTREVRVGSKPAVSVTQGDGGFTANSGRHSFRSSIQTSTRSPLAIRAMLAIETLRSDRSTSLR
jgi:hypothetical protein